PGSRASRRTTSRGGPRVCRAARRAGPKATRRGPAAQACAARTARTPPASNARARAWGDSQHGARDHELLDLRGPLVDLGDLRVAEGALHLVLLHEAVAAVDLNRVRGYLHRGL